MLQGPGSHPLHCHKTRQPSNRMLARQLLIFFCCFVSLSPTFQGLLLWNGPNCLWFLCLYSGCGCSLGWVWSCKAPNMSVAGLYLERLEHTFSSPHRDFSSPEVSSAGVDGPGSAVLLVVSSSCSEYSRLKMRLTQVSRFSSDFTSVSGASHCITSWGGSVLFSHFCRCQTWSVGSDLLVWFLCSTSLRV